MEENSAKSQLEKIDAVLDEYENKIGLPSFQLDQNELSSYMNMSREVMERLTPIQCCVAADYLISAAFHFQKMKNREDARVIWAEGQMNRSATGRMSQYSVGSFNQNFMAAVLDDQYTLKLFDIKQYASQRSKRIDYLPNILRDKAECFKTMARTKENKYG